MESLEGIREEVLVCTCVHVRVCTCTLLGKWACQYAVRASLVAGRWQCSDWADFAEDVRGNLKAALGLRCLSPPRTHTLTHTHCIMCLQNQLWSLCRQRHGCKARDTCSLRQMFCHYKINACWSIKSWEFGIKMYLLSYMCWMCQRTEKSGQKRSIFG